MQLHYTIYENLIKDENSLTEALKNNLKLKPFRDVFLDCIDIDWLDKDLISFEDIETQASIGKYGRPDLLIRTESIELLIEIKVYDTQTTANQPQGYLDYLATVKKDKKALIFIVPETYFKLTELKVKLMDVKLEYVTGIISWRSLIDLTKRKELTTYNLLLREFYNFLHSWFIPSKQIFTLNNINCMYSKDFGEGLEKTLLLIDNIEDQLKKRGVKLKSSRPKYFQEYGFYIHDNEKNELIFFGLWLEYWKNTGLPLIIGLEGESSETITTFKSSFKTNGFAYNTYDFNGSAYRLFFIEKHLVSNERNEIIIADTIDEFLQKIK